MALHDDVSGDLPRHLVRRDEDVLTARAEVVHPASGHVVVNQKLALVCPSLSVFRRFRVPSLRRDPAGSIICRGNGKQKRDAPKKRKTLDSLISILLSLSAAAERECVSLVAQSLSTGT